MLGNRKLERMRLMVHENRRMVRLNSGPCLLSSRYTFATTLPPRGENSDLQATCMGLSHAL